MVVSRRVTELAGRRELVIDAGIGAVVTVVVALAIMADIGGSRGPDAGAYLFALGLGLLMLVRRQYPVLALTATSAGLVAYYIADYPPVGLAVPVAAALYSVAEYGRLRMAVGFALALLIGSTGFRLLEGDPAEYLLGYELAWSIAIMGGAIALGDGVRSRRIRSAEQQRREEQLLRDSEREADRRIEQERLAIARDLHDVLAHTTTVITLQADVAGEALDDGDDAVARDALAVIRSASGEATRELRSTVAVLRQPSDSASTAPVASLRHVEQLARVTRESGLSVTVTTDGDPISLPATVDTTAYRVVQESLTNAVRHASASQVSVAVQYQPDRLDVTVTDDGRGYVAPRERHDSTGTGLAWMRERVELVGGTLVARNVDDGGFEVFASLPVTRLG